MPWAATRLVTVTVRSKRPEPFVSTMSPSRMPVSTTMPEVWPARALWMCAPVRLVFGGKPDMTTVKSAVADVMFCAESRLTCSTTLTLPLADASALVTGGTSFVGNNCVVNVGAVNDGETGSSSLQATDDSKARLIARIRKRVIGRGSLSRCRKANDRPPACRRQTARHGMAGLARDLTGPVRSYRHRLGAFTD